MTDCKCHKPPLWHLDYERIDVGTDKEGYGEVSIEICQFCGAKWLQYFVEYPHRTASGRWYRGIVPDSLVTSINPDNAIETLESLDWWLCGGSYFATPGRKQSAPLSMRLEHIRLAAQ
jgi:hypothetical protein